MSSFLEYGDEEDEDCIKNIFGRSSDSSTSSNPLLYSSIEIEEKEQKEENNEEKKEENSVLFYEITTNLNQKFTLEIETNKSKGIAHQLWPASLLLCNFIQLNFNELISNPLNTEIIELGAGVGLNGIVLGLLGCPYVTITDLPEAIELITRNIERNQHLLSSSSSIIHSDILRWGVNEDLRHYPITSMTNLLIIASDCVYWEHLYSSFFETLDYFITTYNASIILSHFKRWKKEKKFFVMCEKRFKIEILYEKIEVVPIGDEHIDLSIRNEFETKEGGRKIQTRKQISRIYRMSKKV